MFNAFKRFAVLAVIAGALAALTPGDAGAFGCRGGASARGGVGLFNGPIARAFRAVFAPIVERVQARQSARAEARAARYAVEYHADGSFTESAGVYLPVPGSVPTVMQGPGSTYVVPMGSHAHRDANGNVIVHGNENAGVPGAHSGMSTKRIAEGDQAVAGPVAVKPASPTVTYSVLPAGKPKRVMIDGKYYDRYADGSLVECVACNRGR